MADTNAIKWLRTQNVPFDVIEYTFSEIGAESAAAAVDKPLEMVCKTLIVKAPGKALYVAIVPGDQRFDARLMAKAVGVKTIDLAETDEAEKASGYKVGGLSPFSMRRPLPTYIEESLLALDRIIVNGGKRGIMIEIDTEQLIQTLNATPANICG